MKRLTTEDFQMRLEAAHPLEKLQAIEWGGDREPSIVKCLTCGTEYIKNGGNFLDKRKVSICKVCYPTHINRLKDTYELPQSYTYIEKYRGMQNKVLIRHDCGFIWSITPANIKLGKGCPKCNRKTSKGEQKIISWLNNNNIEYQTQYKIEIEGHHLSIDFYLPEFNLYIEYNGEQHYKPVAYFGGIPKFKSQCELDSLKRKHFQDTLLEIPYTQFENIEEILKSSTTISKESTLQAMAMEVEKLLQGV